VKALVDADPVTAVIHAMRRMEALPADSGRRRAQLIEECLRLLGASSVAFCRLRKSGEIVLHHVAGNAPDADAMAEIIACAADASRNSFSLLQRRPSSDLVLAGRGAEIVSAILPTGSERWVEDVVAFVAERLIRASTKSAGTGRVSAPTTAGLVLPPEMVIGASAAMRDLLQQMSATVSSGIDVLLSGETGTGKELLARVVHQSGPTRSGPFVAINCAAIPGEMLEAELFGVERGVATGVDPRRGLFVEADRGSMFLDEIAELPDRLQAKLLRVIQEREVLAVGATRPRKISARIISASNQDLSRLVAEGRFRADLYYRLRGLEFHAPPLRERSEDIPALALNFLMRAAEEYGKEIAGITNDAMGMLQSHAWPGNIRELQTEIRRAVLVCPNGESLQREHLFFASRVAAVETTTLLGDAPQPTDSKTMLLRDRLAAVERVEIENALRAAGGNRSLAARMLGITRNGLTHKLRRLGLQFAARRGMRKGLRGDAQ
jgi:transcriptional regulator with PAS, ATPase and Fis domain